MRHAVRALGASLAAAAAGMAVLLCVTWYFGYPPVAVMRAFVQSVAGGTDRLSATLLVACPLLLTGLGVCVAFRCGVWNIGAEGQYLVGALAACAVGIHLGAWPAWVAAPLTLLAGVAAGAIWAGLAAWLKLIRRVQEVLSTILLNFVAIQLVAIMVHGPLADPLSAQRDTTSSIVAAARLPLLSSRHGLHAGVVIALLAAIGAWFFLRHTVPGLRLRIVGANPIAARLARLPVTRYAATAFLLSGALAGLAGAIELAGNSYYLTARYGAGYGYTAIAVAMLARLSPAAVVPAALFFAILDTGVRGLQHADLEGAASFPTTLTFAAQGAVVLLVAWLAGPPKRMGET